MAYFIQLFVLSLIEASNWINIYYWFLFTPKTNNVQRLSYDDLILMKGGEVHEITQNNTNHIESIRKILKLIKILIEIFN